MLVPKESCSELVLIGLLMNFGNEGFESRRGEKKELGIKVPCLLSAGSPWPLPSRYPPRSQGCTAFKTFACRPERPAVHAGALAEKAMDLNGKIARLCAGVLLSIDPARWNTDLPVLLSLAHPRHRLGSELYPVECARSKGIRASTEAGMCKSSSGRRTKPDPAARTLARKEFADWRSSAAGDPA